MRQCVAKKLNADQKRARVAGELTTFVQQYARKAYPNWDPNDRRYDRDVEKRVKRMRPEELDQLLRDDDS
jgi:hypothetical protein